MKKLTLTPFLVLVCLLTFVSSCKKADKCPSASNLKASEISGDNAKVSWDATTDATIYTVQYRIQGSGTWETITTSTENAILIDLDAGTTYEWQVKTACSSSISEFSKSSSFKTCAAGYEGSGCSTEVRAKIISTYAVSEDCSITGEANYDVTITKSGVDVTKVLISPFGGYPGTTGTVGLDGTSLDIPSQTSGGLTFSGTGTINNSGTTISVTYTISDGTNSESCTGTWTKK